MAMRLHIRIEFDPPRSPESGCGVFRAATAGPVPRIAMLTWSVAAHILLVVLIAVISRQVAMWNREDAPLDMSRYHVEMLRLHLSEPLFFRPSAAGGMPSAHNGTGSQRRRSSVPPELEFPAQSDVSTRGPLILQPDLGRQAKASSRLASVAAWARQEADQTPPKQIEDISPGRTEDPAPAPRPVARPSLAVPNREEIIGDINISRAQIQAQEPTALARSATSPIANRDATEARSARFDMGPGQPANILIMAAERDSRDMQISRGLRNLPASNASDGLGGIGHMEIASEAPAGGKLIPEVASGPAATAVSARTKENSGTTRIEHNPNGTFDVVVMQTASRDDLPDTRILRGSPVYTVYLRVGDRKEWMLEYCVPTRETPSSGPHQVDLEGATPLTPPYPIFTTIPGNIVTQAIDRRVVLHGTLTAGGILQDMKASGEQGPLAVQILSLLRQWQFRPAQRNKKFVDVEILLVVPARS